MANRPNQSHFYIILIDFPPQIYELAAALPICGLLCKAIINICWFFLNNFLQTKRKPIKV